MRPFEYISVRSTDEACSVLGEYGSDASILAGGTDSLIEWRRSAETPPRAVMDISFITELKGIDLSDSLVTLRPLTTHTEIMTSEVVRKCALLLSSAAAGIGSVQIRNRGSVGGNIMNAAACADTVPPLIALGATVRLQSKAGARTMDLIDLFVKPYCTKAHADELLTEITFARLPLRARSSFIKLGRRNALSISRLSVAAVLAQDEEGRITNASIVPGAAFPTWQRVREAEQLLMGQKPSVELFTEAGRKVSQMMTAHSGKRWSTEYKEPVIAALVRRSLEACSNGQQ